MAKRDTSKRVNVALTEEQAAALAAYRTARGHKTETAAVKALIKRGLAEIHVAAAAAKELRA